MLLSKRVGAVAVTGFRLLWRDPAPALLNMAMPLVLAAFLLPGAKAQLQLGGFPGANGAELVIPGMAILFAFLGTQMVGTLFFREHAWGTWDRLRVSGATTFDLLLGKALPLLALQLLNFLVLVGGGAAFFGFRYTGSGWALAALLASFGVLVVSFGLFLVATCATMDMAIVLGNFGGMVLAGLGGAIAPVTSLPEWVQIMAWGNPVYWTLAGLHDVALTGAGFAEIWPALLITIGTAAVLLLIAGWRFQPAAAKVGTT